MNKIPLLLLPGMMCDVRLWQAQITALADLCSPVVVGDISAGRSVEAIARRVLARAPESFALAGLSMGGIVALEMWRQAPQRITHLALLDTNAHADLPERRALRQGQTDRAYAGGLRELMIQELKPNYLAQVNKSNASLLDTVLDMATKLGAEVFANQSAALCGRPDSSTTLATIDCPTLVLCGEDDVLCPVEHHRFMANKIPGAELVVLAHCGHLSTMEQPERVSEAMRHWLTAAK